jgi:hypothetical protein
LRKGSKARAQNQKKGGGKGPGRKERRETRQALGEIERQAGNLEEFRLQG